MHMLEGRIGESFSPLRNGRNLLQSGKRKRRKPVTLCAAAIFGFPYLDEQGADEPLEPGVMTISDCMLTSFGSGDDIEFETDQTKIYPLIAGKAIALVSNSIDLHRMLVDETIKQIEASKIEDVSQAAEIYCENFKSLRRKRAESIWLAPYNLNADSFISRQRQFDQGIARDLAHRLLEEKLEVESIIAGVDSNGTPRIYSIEDPGILTSRDGVAFHAIGSGARQFESLFMAEGYTRTRTWAETMFLMYSAKKKAES